MGSYYIDYAGGADTNNGTSDSTPFQHCPGDSNATDTAASTTFSAGDIVYFKKGVDYLGQITCGQSGGEKESGSDATITVGGVLTSAGATFQTNGVTTACYVYIYHSKAAVTGTWVESTGFFSISSVDSETQLTLSDFDGIAYATDEMTYIVSLPITYTSIDSWGSGEAVIDEEDGGDWAFKVGGRSHLLFDDLRIENLADTDSDPEYRGAVTCYGGSAANYIFIQNCYFYNIDNDTAYLGNYFVLKNNTMNGVLCYIFVRAVAGYGQHSLIEGNVSTGGGTRSFNNGAYTIYRYNSWKDLTTQKYGLHQDGIGPIDQGAGNDVRYMWVYGNTFDNTVETVFIDGNTTMPEKLVFHSNVIIGRYGTTGYGDKGFTVKGGQYFYIFNNTFVNPSTDPLVSWWMYFQDETGEYNSYVIVKNNIFLSNDNYVAFGTNSTTGADVDYNQYYRPSGGYEFMWAGSTKNSYASWRTDSGQDVNSNDDITVDPKLVDTTYSSVDAHLQSDSPCIGAGTDLSSYFTLDKDKTVRTNWDIGAYEYESGPAAGPSRLVMILSQIQIMPIFWAWYAMAWFVLIRMVNRFL